MNQDNLENMNEITTLQDKPVIKPGRRFKDDDSARVWVYGSEHVKTYFNEYHNRTKEERYRKVICETCKKQYAWATRARHEKSQNHIKKSNLLISG